MIGALKIKADPAACFSVLSACWNFEIVSDFGFRISDFPR